MLNFIRLGFLSLQLLIHKLSSVEADIKRPSGPNYNPRTKCNISLSPNSNLKWHHPLTTSAQPQPLPIPGANTNTNFHPDPEILKNQPPKLLVPPACDVSPPTHQAMKRLRSVSGHANAISQSSQLLKPKILPSWQ